MTLRERIQLAWLDYRTTDDVPLSSAALTLLAWKQGHRGIRSVMQVPAYRDILRLPIDPLSGEPPAPVEILLVVAPRDFRTLPVAVEAALSNSSNPVTGVVAVTTAEGVAECRRLITERARGVCTTVHAEDDILKEDIRRRLLERFGSRYGWVLQQILTMECVTVSESCGVWVVDSDTVMLRSRTLLTQSGLQILTPTLEFHSDYYNFLHAHGVCERRPSHSFVSHWMMMQPVIARSALAALGCRNGGDLALLVAEEAEQGGAPVSVDYELYAQHAMSQWPDRVKLARWANIPVPLEPGMKVLPADELVRTFGRYASISFHSHLS